MKEAVGGHPQSSTTPRLVVHPLLRWSPGELMPSLNFCNLLCISLIVGLAKVILQSSTTPWLVVHPLLRWSPEELMPSLNFCNLLCISLIVGLAKVILQSSTTGDWWYIHSFSHVFLQLLPFLLSYPSLVLHRSSSIFHNSATGGTSTPSVVSRRTHAFIELLQPSVHLAHRWCGTGHPSIFHNSVASGTSTPSVVSRRTNALIELLQPSLHLAHFCLTKVILQYSTTPRLVVHPLLRCSPGELMPSLNFCNLLCISLIVGLAQVILQSSTARDWWYIHSSSHVFLQLLPFLLSYPSLVWHRYMFIITRVMMVLPSGGYPFSLAQSCTLNPTRNLTSGLSGMRDPIRTSSHRHSFLSFLFIPGYSLGPRPTSGKLGMEGKGGRKLFPRFVGAVPWFRSSEDASALPVPHTPGTTRGRKTARGEPSETSPPGVQVDMVVAHKMV
ncbi:hypothetical protein AAG570_007082 [Ranatra chinensis]|uniref:Uncharacterized protein n=1 Tax=Ranatra chinensis TaxID=642074 RepID=A0ABD0XUT8_9HEMI